MVQLHVVISNDSPGWGAQQQTDQELLELRTLNMLSLLKMENIEFIDKMLPKEFKLANEKIPLTERKLPTAFKLRKLKTALQQNALRKAHVA